MFCPTDNELAIIGIFYKTSLGVGATLSLLTLFTMFKVKSPASKLYRNIQIGSVIFSQCLDLGIFLTEPIYLLPSTACSFGDVFGLPLHFKAQLIKYYLNFAVLVLETLLFSLLYKLHAVGYSRDAPKLFFLHCFVAATSPVFFSVLSFVILNEYEVVDSVEFVLLALKAKANSTCQSYQQPIVFYPRQQDSKIAIPVLILVSFGTAWLFYIIWLTFHYANSVKKTVSQQTKEMIQYLQIVFFFQSLALLTFFILPTVLGIFSVSNLLPIENIFLSSMALIQSFHSPFNCLILISATRVYRKYVIKKICAKDYANSCLICTSKMK